jgi:hypothetical protein
MNKQNFHFESGSRNTDKPKQSCSYPDFFCGPAFGYGYKLQTLTLKLA